MCEFCLKHGEGKKWYLQAKNYSDDLLADLHRKKFIQEFLNPETIRKQVEKIAALEKAPAFVRRAVAWRISRKMKKIHYGQVVPIEEVERIFGFVNSITRVACLCRHISLGQEKRYCYGVSLGPNGGGFGEIARDLDSSFLKGAQAPGAEILDREEALHALRGYEKEGLCHTVWTFHAPFIGGICNCDRADCLAMQATITHGISVMFRAEYVAEISPDLCNGCRQCMRVCQFGALAYSVSNQKALIDQRHCYGCGICRSVCSKDAIQLRDRSQVSAVADLW